MKQIHLSENHIIPTDLGNLKIKEPYKPPVGPYKLPGGVETVSDEDIAQGPSSGTFFTRPFMSSHDRKAVFEVATAQGDKVTLTYERSAVMSSYLHVEGSYVPGLPRINTATDSFSMTVDGDLDEQELADIAAFQEDLSAIVEDYLSRRTTGLAETEDVEMTRYESLTEYAMTLDYASSTSYASGMVKGYNPDTQIETGLASPAERQPGAFTGSSMEPMQTRQILYNNQGQSTLGGSDQKIGTIAAKFTALGNATEKVFEALSTKNDASPDAYRDALGVLKRDFSGLIEKLMDMFEKPEPLKHILGNRV